MRTFAAATADCERDRYTGPAQHDERTQAGAKAILSNPEAQMLARQTTTQLRKHGPQRLETLPASARIVRALATLGLVVTSAQGAKTTLVSLSPTGAKMAARKMEGA